MQQSNRLLLTAALILLAPIAVILLGVAAALKAVTH